MRISKLFHWLYAFLMMLPIFAVGSKVLYVTINQNAKDSYYGESINEQSSILTNNLELNKNYYVSASQIITTPRDNYFDQNFYIQNARILNDDNYDFSTTTYFRYYLRTDGRKEILTFTNTDVLTYDIYITRDNLIFQFEYLGQVTYLGSGAININEIDGSLFYYYDYNDYSFIDNAFYYAVDQVKNEPLFSWVNTSAVYTPISYGSALFGVPNNSAINTYLAYWLNVSIIWLMFDVLIYVPLLAHRWLDKGIRE